MVVLQLLLLIFGFNHRLYIFSECLLIYFYYFSLGREINPNLTNIG